MTNETEMYPSEMKQEKKECYCCHKVKEGIYIKNLTNNVIDNKTFETLVEVRFVCNDCNHLKPKVEKER